MSDFLIPPPLPIDNCDSGAISFEVLFVIWWVEMIYLSWYTDDCEVRDKHSESSSTLLIHSLERPRGQSEVWPVGGSVRPPISIVLYHHEWINPIIKIKKKMGKLTILKLQTLIKEQLNRVSFARLGRQVTLINYPWYFF